MNVEAPAPARQPWWKRPLRLAFALFTLLAIVAILAPYGVALLFEKRLGDELTRKFGVPCRFESMRFGWLSGVTAHGLEIGNARGFDASHPALRMESARFAVEVARLFSGEIALTMQAQGVEVFLDERDDGETNFAALGEAYAAESMRDGSTDASDPDPVAMHLDAETGELPSPFLRLQLRMSLADSTFEYRRGGVALESLLSLDLVLEKDSGSSVVRSRLDASAAPIAEGQPEGTLRLEVEGDARTRSGSLSARLARCDLSRWLPLLEAKLPQVAITQLAGVVDGAFEARIEPTRATNEPDIATSGDLTVDGLRLAGPLMSGFELAAKKCILRPTGRIASAPLLRDRASLDMAISKSSLDLGLEAVELKVGRDGAPIDSFAVAKIAANKSLGAPRLRALVELEGAASNPETAKASLLCTFESDTNAKFTRGVAQVQGVEIGRYRRFLDSLVSAQDLAHAEGLLSGRIDFEADFGSARRIDLNGEALVERPRFAGTLLQGVDLRGSRFLFQPSVRALIPDIDGVNRIDLGKTSIDLGFASLSSLDAAARKERGIVEGGACMFRADLLALTKLGGPFAHLAGTTGEATGTLLLPKEMFEGGMDRAMAQLRDLAKIHVEAQVRGLSCNYKGFQLLDAAANAELADGVLTARSADGTRLNAGSLRFDIRADTTRPQIPFELSLGWKGGAVEGEAAALLRYVVPLLAGTSGKAADFRSVCDMNLNLQGFALREGEQSALQWIDGWTANGDITLSNGRIVPAPSMQQLLTLLEQPIELAVDRMGSAFMMQQGAISHRAMKWISKGKDYGLSGTVRLDGTMDLAVDVTSVLQQHRDGRAIAGFLGKQPLTASLGGTLDAPKFVAPDLGKLLQQALQAAPRQLLEQRGQDLLQEGLERLFGEKKKKVDPDKKQ